MKKKPSKAVLSPAATKSIEDDVIAQLSERKKKTTKKDTRGKSLTIAYGKKRFLKAYLEVQQTKRACELAGVTLYQVYKWNDEDKKFAQAWSIIKKIIADELEEEAIKRAKTRSDALLMFILRGSKPEKYEPGVVSKNAALAGPPVASPAEWVSAAADLASGAKDLMNEDEDDDD